jgi:succinyl-CoA synthetase alpha subunit
VSGPPTSNSGGALLTRGTKVLVQGVTGREASFWTGKMNEYGTAVVAGVTPGRGGQTVHGVPVYNSVQEATARHAIDATVLFVPPLAVKLAAQEAMRAGIKAMVVLAEHVPIQDVIEVVTEARDQGVKMVGPNCPGIVVPGSHFLGIMPAWAKNIFQAGSLGVVSRSGSLGTLICLNLVRAGLGQSAFFGIGGDPILGTTIVDTLEWFEADPGTRAVVLVGEIGGRMEEESAGFVAKMTKPVVAFIGGQSAPAGKRMGHAGAIVSGGRGSAREKMDALRRAGARVAAIPSQVSGIVLQTISTTAGNKAANSVSIPGQQES